MSYSVLSPFVIPPELRGRKRPNIGDGFILHRIFRLLEPFGCAHVLSTRAKLGEGDLEKINSTKALVLAGANQLNDHYSLVPEFNPSDLRKIRVPILPFGIGISGDRERNLRMSERTRSILREIHERIRYSSWRCPRTMEYLAGQLPGISDRFLLTGCPVVYDGNLLDGTPFRTDTDRVAVTVTERNDFWERETRTIDFVAERFGSAEKYLSLHQSYGAPAGPSWANLLPSRRKREAKRNRIADLHRYARERGFSVLAPESVESCWDLYRGIDLHIGSRLHAHLFFLSQAKKSFLTYVDDRMTGFSSMLEFPLCDFRRFEEYMGYDFEIYRRKSREHYGTMQRFVLYVTGEIL